MGWDRKTLDDIGETVDALERASDRYSLLDALRVFTSERGFQHVGIGQLVNPATVPGPLSNLGAADFPDELLAYWLEHNQIMLDPIARYAVAARNAFTWKTAYERATKAGRRVLDRGRDYGLSSGLAVPIAVPDMPVGLITLSHPDPTFSETEVAALEIVSVHAYNRLLDLTGAEPLPHQWSLTGRETEVMHYVAAGKTNWEIGAILGVTEHAVKVHLRNVARKVNASNRAHAVMKTLRAGDIIP